MDAIDAAIEHVEPKPQASLPLTLPLSTGRQVSIMIPADMSDDELFEFISTVPQIRAIAMSNRARVANPLGRLLVPGRTPARGIAAR